MKFIRRRRADTPREEDRSNEDLAPVLFAPRPAPPANGNARAALPVEPVIEAFRQGIAQSRVKPNASQNVATFIADAPPADPDETVVLLPGRLEPLAAGVQQEIRFVKVGGITRFTFGRSPGPAHTHIQLRARTASRMHGYMIFENGQWRIGNLSETNAVIVNGSRLEVEGSERLLQDGDRIEFGEVAFVFHER